MSSNNENPNTANPTVNTLTMASAVRQLDIGAMHEKVLNILASIKASGDAINCFGLHLRAH